MATGTKRTAAKKKTGRPPQTLTARSQIRHAAGEWEAWTAHAQAWGFASAGAWLRSLANAAVAAPKNGISTPSRS